MGVNFSYLLYFPKENFGEVLQSLLEISENGDPAVRIQFPDHDIYFPFRTTLSPRDGYKFDDAEINLATVLRFKEDEAILDWIYDSSRNQKDCDQNSLEVEQECRFGVGYIYLTIYNDLKRRVPNNEEGHLVLFDFGTTGTKMSMLFNYSTSIREEFVKLLELHHGVCGVFNREYEGDLFWMKGIQMDKTIEDAYTPPSDIERLLESGDI